MPRPSWSQVVTEINGHLGTDYRLIDRLEGGHQGGAWVISERGRSSTERVLTWTLDAGLVARREQTAEIVETLRARGYPTPRWREWGTVRGGLAFVIADLAPGRTATWAVAPVDELITAVEMQADLASPSDESWSSYLIWALTADDGPRADLLSLGTDATALLRRIDATAARLRDTPLPSTDAVHGDLTIANILVAEAHVDHQPSIAIIDIDACGPGTRAIDYAWLYRDALAHGAAPAALHLEKAGREVAGDDVWQLCLALACLELAAFVARHGTAGHVTAELTRLAAVLSAGLDAEARRRAPHS